ncbi:lysophospholipase [Acetobacter malorum]|nr:lysophospholipase [Acetobacter malorum]
MLRSVLNRVVFSAVIKAGWSGLATCGMLALPACSTTMPPVPKPPSRFAQLGQLVPPEKIFTLSDGAKIPARLWQASAPPRAIFLALHGFNDSRDAWESSAPFFAARGVTVVAPDQRGFGQAPERGGWAGTARMVEDVREEVTQLQQVYPHTPLYLAGESMGGAVLMQLMAQPNAPHVAGTILLAPAVWNFSWATDVPLKVLARLFPDSLVTGRELPVHVVASDNMLALARLYYDPLTLRATRLKALQGLVTLMKQAAHAAPHLHGPVLCVYGDHDQLVPPTAMVPVWQNMPAGTRLDLISGGHHLLLRDRQGTRVMQDMLSWINTPEHWLPSGGDSAVAAWLATGVGEPGAEKQDAPLPILPSMLDRLVLPEAR